jgi:hypothetical protein
VSRDGPSRAVACPPGGAVPRPAISCRIASQTSPTLSGTTHVVNLRFAGITLTGAENHCSTLSLNEELLHLRLLVPRRQPTT